MEEASAFVANLLSTADTSSLVAKLEILGIADTSALVANLVSTSVTFARPSIDGTCIPATASVTSCLVARPETSGSSDFLAYVDSISVTLAKPSTEGIALTSALVANLSLVSALVYTLSTLLAIAVKSECSDKFFNVAIVSASKPLIALTASFVAYVAATSVVLA